jgi:hypothetical protein
MHCVHSIHQEEGGEKSKNKSTHDEKGFVMYNKNHE